VVKKFLDERHVSYEVRNVLEDEQAAREFLRLGGRVPPLLVIAGELVHGFQPDTIDAAIGRAEKEPPR
jgi:arsenate reductase-like glutaredoxin family protein